MKFLEVTCDIAASHLPRFKFLQKTSRKPIDLKDMCDTLPEYRNPCPKI